MYFKRQLYNKNLKAKGHKKIKMLINRYSCFLLTRTAYEIIFLFSRETYVKTSVQLMMRRRQLISELCEIYPIVQVAKHHIQNKTSSV